MTVVVDTSVVIDALRGHADALQRIRGWRGDDVLRASEITKLEVLAGMRPGEERVTRNLLGVFTWHPVDAEIAELAGELGRRWLPGNRGIDAADLAIAATALSLEAELATLNLKHFPMFDGLTRPY
ncbi:PIN domain-containing protein [Agromyces aerolatus]|uniref:PIN domain-containing protein n=1 Tax=Agromyces sp. LY-1074 TaxID=3074080 RepID=UPI00285CC752|nr:MULTISPECIES: PIN domain-containing protein [unclassified Agromyces]MDR5699605.1 PIN domain-containing protein [Agromyces sp. LY-1074]MDR5705901.1 PIN domain-containing protein [Agromyces sp. LY-1358]